MIIYSFLPLCMFWNKSRAMGSARKIVPRPPPAPYSRPVPPAHVLRNMPASMEDERNQMVYMTET